MICVCIYINIYIIDILAPFWPVGGLVRAPSTTTRTGEREREKGSIVPRRLHVIQSTPQTVSRWQQCRNTLKHHYTHDYQIKFAHPLQSKSKCSSDAPSSPYGPGQS